jgi:hypothetical protein
LTGDSALVGGASASRPRQQLQRSLEPQDSVRGAQP